MGLTQTVHLKVADRGITQTIHAVQNDTGRNLKVILDDYTITQYTLPRFSFKRSDGTFYDVAADVVDSSTNSITVGLDQALTCAGQTLAQFKIMDQSDGNSIVTTFDLVIMVEPDRSGSVTAQEGLSITDALNGARLVGTYTNGNYDGPVVNSSVLSLTFAQIYNAIVAGKQVWIKGTWTVSGSDPEYSYSAFMLPVIGCYKYLDNYRVYVQAPIRVSSLQSTSDAAKPAILVFSASAKTGYPTLLKKITVGNNYTSTS